MPNYSYSTTTGDPRVWVHDGGVCVGWVEGGRFVPIVTETETEQMLQDALKRKPSTKDQQS